MYMDTRADGYDMTSTVLALVHLDTIQKCMCSNVSLKIQLYVQMYIFSITFLEVSKDRQKIKQKNRAI